ncbi:MAG: deoxyribodipyrimidine photo-lyase [Flavobacteriales bacterium]|nr:deoxyribodipyrimidine photo-lyase [Flavobacteriaceae bacterium]MDG1767075.1 deoxyribodipyrimidine photo-lyase [Flavobacteriales bacterium]
MDKIAIHWHRRDLRLEDNAALFKALSSGLQVLPVFIFDKHILDRLEHPKDQRLLFIHQELQSLKKKLNALGSDLWVHYGTPQSAFEALLKHYSIAKVFTNRDYEPYAKERDAAMHQFFQDKQIEFIGAKDHVIFEKSEVVKDDGLPYTVFTPYSKKWKSRLHSFPIETYPSENHQDAFLKCSNFDLPSLKSMGFEEFEEDFPDKTVDKALLSKYKDQRDIPAVRGTSRLSVHLRFGTVSIRSLALQGAQQSESWLNELIWRDFYQMIIHHFPESVDHEFKSKYAGIPWRNNETEFKAWCEGKTGYPLVDAGMRELNRTGFMHNRVRMVVASFLTKHLLIDWRWGERYFAEKLIDFELASNVGGWQWASGTGCDAAPYFRVFNPESQLKKFDQDYKYVKRWVPEFGSPSYPKPIVEHKMARQRALDTYKSHLS